MIVSVLTPESEILHSEEARSVVLRSSDGDLTVLDGHTPIVTDVVPGEVRVEPAEGDAQHLAVHGGYLQVESGPASSDVTRVTLLAPVAELARDIDVARAERARDAAQPRVDALRGSDDQVELADAEAQLRRAQVRLEVAGEG